MEGLSFMGTDDPQPHLPVLLDAVLDALQIRPGAVIIDGTLGAGGHAAAMLESGCQRVKDRR